MEDHYKLYLAMSDTRLQSLDQIRGTIIRSGPGGLVRLDNVATISEGTSPQWIRVTADGRDAVIFQVHQQPGGNTVQIAQEIKAKLAGFQKQLSADIKIANWYDQSELILASEKSVRDSILVGVVFAILILLLFLRNLKITLIAAIAVPGVLAATILLLYVCQMSFNIMTLGGMAAAVGLIIDDAIVMVEHIMRRLREAPTDHRGQVLRAASEFTKSLAGSSVSTIIIFVPLAFLSGVTGAFFKALSLTMAVSLVISFFVAWLAVPLLADRFLNEKDARRKRNRPFHPASPRSLRGDDASTASTSVVGAPRRHCVPCNGLDKLPACRLRISCHRWTREDLFSIIDLNRGLHSRKPIACCAKLKPSYVRHPTWKRIPAARDCSLVGG